MEAQMAYKRGTRIDTAEFIRRATNIHGEYYDYSNVVYKNSKTKICILCPTHGEFQQTSNSHLTGRGCPKCGRNITTVESVIRKGVKKHNNKYTYTPSTYVNMTTKMLIHCPIHGDFWQTPSAHVAGYGCKQCQYDIKRKTKGEFIADAISIYGDMYDYSSVVYKNNATSIKIICKKHGPFYQTAGNHIFHKCGCPKCSGSIGVLIIQQWLDDNNIDYVREYSIDGLIGIHGGLLRFDFYIEDINTVIEYDGAQHYSHIPSFQTEDVWNNLKQHDYMKDTYCLDHSMTLIRIRYDVVNIISLLEEIYENTKN